MNCKYCKSENIVYVEYMGAYDGALEEFCNDCNKRHHIFQNQEIISSRDATDRKYGPIEFTLADGRKVINTGRGNGFIEPSL